MPSRELLLQVQDTAAHGAVSARIAGEYFTALHECGDLVTPLTSSDARFAVLCNDLARLNTQRAACTGGLTEIRDILVVADEVAAKDPLQALRMESVRNTTTLCASSHPS